MDSAELEQIQNVEAAQIGPLKLQRFRRSEAIQLIRTAVLMHQPLDIAICNAHTILSALDDSDYANVLGQMTLLNDGIGANLASKFLYGEGFPANLNGTDFVPAVLARAGVSLRIYLLGSHDEELRLARDHIERTYPMHTVVGIRNGYFDREDTTEICAEISAHKPDLLLVAMGNPLQEQFIVRNRDQLNVGVAIGVGALIDFMSGSAERAPQFIRSFGLEWLYRFVREPRRLFRRYVIGIPRFLFALLKLKHAQKTASH